MFGSGSPRASIRPAPAIGRESTAESHLNAASGHAASGHAARVSVVIPALNEARNLPFVLPQIPKDVHEVILVDGASVDDTVAIARSILPSIRVIVEPRRGKGAALTAGFGAAEGDIIVMLDADGSTDPNEIPRFVDALIRGADFAKGSRFLPDGGSSDITAVRAFGNWGFVALVRLLFGGGYTDLCYGYNAMWASVLPVLALDGNGFEIETMMNVRALREGLRIAEVPSFERPRLHGESNLRAFRDGVRILRVILRERLSRGRAVGTWDALRPAAATMTPPGGAAAPHLVPVMDPAASGMPLPDSFELGLIRGGSADSLVASVAERTRLVPVMDATTVEHAGLRSASALELAAEISHAAQHPPEFEMADSPAYAAGGEI